MKQNTFTTQILTAEDNHYLTQADDNVEILQRIVADTVALGKYDSPENWKEITKEEADEILRQQEEARQADEHPLEYEEDKN